MNYIEQISKKYNGNILLCSPYEGKKEDPFPEELYSILRISNGILETMFFPKTGKSEVISWIVYSYEMIQEWTTFHRKVNNLEGIVFSDNGAGDPYIIKPDGIITCYNPIDGEEEQVASSLYEFYR